MVVCCGNVLLHGSVGGRVSCLLKGTNLPVSLQKCAEIIVAHLGYLNYTQYTVTVGFEDLDLPSIKEMNFTVSIPADLTCLRSSFVQLPLFCRVREITQHRNHGLWVSGRRVQSFLKYRKTTIS